MQRRNDLIIALVLFVGTICLYARAFTFGYINYDDDAYVYENAHVTSGLSLENLKWAFTTGRAANWHPVTWISHMIDAQVYGVQHPGGHHATNILLHAINAILVYGLFRRFTCHLWLAGLGAALFAWHPLRVESVVWIAERKDLLAGFFWLTATHAYLRYVNHRTAGRYVLVLLLLALGLMSKPMLVTFPFALLLLDLWPLRRISLDSLLPRETGRLLVEKMPMIGLVVASSVVTFFVQRAGQAVAMTTAIPIHLRLENAAVAVMAYLGQFVVPLNLSVFYPHPGFFPNGSIEVWKWTVAVAMILIISTAAILLIRRLPFLFVGWFFFLGTLIPVIGIVQVGAQAMADRYTYLPMLGITVIVICALAKLVNSSGQWKPVIAALVSIILFSSILLTRNQVDYWKDSRTLMSRAIQLDNRNYIAHNNLAIALEESNDKEAAEVHYRKALAFNERFPHAEFNLANILEAKGDIEEALKHFNRAVRLDPEYPGAYNNYGNLLTKLGRNKDAIRVYERGVKHCPDNALLKHNLATSLAARGDLGEAIKLWREALSLDANHAETHHLLGVSLAMSGNVREGLIHLRKAVELQPDNAEALNNLAWLLATTTSPAVRDPEQAVKLASRACELTKDGNATYLDTLSVSQAAAGRFDLAREAIANAIKVAQTAEASETMLVNLRARQSLYEKNQPFRPRE